MTLEQLADLTAPADCHCPLAPQPEPSSQNNPAKGWPRPPNWCSKILFWNYTCDGEYFLNLSFPFHRRVIFCSVVHCSVTKSKGCFNSWPAAWHRKVQRCDIMHGLLALLWVNWVNYPQCSTRSRADMLGVTLHNAVIFSTSLLLTLVFKMGITAFPTSSQGSCENKLTCWDAQTLRKSKWSIQGRRDGPTVDYINRYC